ncbi:hypothetical protein GCM10010446_33590 [Streptomyces enissocaesilis]|uniref:Uncharacterized protein n=2 Tax=Streptomyces enissocaesilis TaxID=332589 RepID=A0ABP6JV10_9ACTN
MIMRGRWSERGKAAAGTGRTVMTTATAPLSTGEALPPDSLASIVREAIEAHRDPTVDRHSPAKKPSVARPTSA